VSPVAVPSGARRLVRSEVSHPAWQARTEPRVGATLRELPGTAEASGVEAGGREVVPEGREGKGREVTQRSPDCGGPARDADAPGGENTGGLSRGVGVPSASNSAWNRSSPPEGSAFEA
jgi:hypothetical protein